MASLALAIAGNVAGLCFWLLVITVILRALYVATAGHR